MKCIEITIDKSPKGKMRLSSKHADIFNPRVRGDCVITDMRDGCIEGWVQPHVDDPERVFLNAAIKRIASDHAEASKVAMRTIADLSKMLLGCTFENLD